MYDFTGRTMVVTGGTGVLCGAMAKALAGCGANVVVLARNREKGEATLKEISGPGRAIVVIGDALKKETLQNAAKATLDEFGRIDGLINGAGGNNPQATTRPDLSFFDLPEDALRYVFDLNMLGAILPCQVFGREMAERGEGVILNISSMSAYRPMTRVIGYSAAKAGINNFTHWLAAHMAQLYSPRVRVNAVAPGFFITEQNRRLLTDEKTGELTDRGRSIIAHTPMGRFGEPDDLIGATLWLLSPASAFVTGVVVPVDGGFSSFSGV
ncbi:MAG: SDR family oxidoreductase [Chloracidobacterium sp.]|nr:SDR family oxidoreductase [Chloracidobacterium sp.]